MDTIETQLIHTWARVFHFIQLLSDGNLELYEQGEIFTAMLPLYIYFFHEEIRIYYSGPWVPEPIFDDVILSLICLRALQLFYDTLLNVGIILNTPTIGGKLVCAFDLWLETQYILILQVGFLFLVRIVLDGFFGWPVTRRFYREHVRGELDPIWNA